jgi:hypothetical protein
VEQIPTNSSGADPGDAVSPGSPRSICLEPAGGDEAPMNAPKGAEQWRFAELLCVLPADRPVRRLKTLARLPHEHETRLGPRPHDPAWRSGRAPGPWPGVKSG